MTRATDRPNEQLRYKTIETWLKAAEKAEPNSCNNQVWRECFDMLTTYRTERDTLLAERDALRTALKAAAKALGYCAMPPGRLAPENQSQYRVAADALNEAQAALGQP